MTRTEATARWRAKLNAAHILMTGRALSGTRRYMEKDCFPPTFRQADGRTYVEDPASIGLRHVGNVEAESYGGSRTFERKNDHCGWYTDPEGWVMKDGEGLCWGVVYQLPARRGVMRMAAGYQFGGTDGGPVVDLRRIFTGPSWGHGHSVTDNDVAREAARYADDMARDAAEEERRYREEQREEDEEDAA